MRIAARSLFLAAALALAACGDSAPEWAQADSPKTPKVSVARQEHVVRFAHGSATLSETEADRLADFLGSQGSAGSGVVAISVGPTTGPSGIGSSRERAIRTALGRRGYGDFDVMHGGSGSGGANQVAVGVNRYVVTTPRCPDYSKPPEYNWNNTTHSNFGCANAQNLGVMVADPADLARGRDLGGQDGTQAILSVQRYRAGKVIVPSSVNSAVTGGDGS